MIPASRDISPPAKVRLPHQSSLVGRADAELAQLAVGPYGAEHAERHRDQEDVTPAERAEHAAEHKTDERARDPGHLIQAQGQAALVMRERVGEDRAGVGHQERAADALQDAHHDQPQRGGGAMHPGQREQHGEDREQGEAEVEHLDPAVHVAQPAEADHQDRGHHDVAHDQPQQQAGIAGLQRVHPDAAEDVRQGDQQDRGIDRRHQHAERRVGQRDPLIREPRAARPVHGHPPGGAGLLLVLAERQARLGQKLD